MSGFKFMLISIVVVVIGCCVSYCRCDFSELVNVEEIIENSTLLPRFDDQVASGNFLYINCILADFRVLITILWYGGNSIYLIIQLFM